jgi:DNA-binding SARP family transcriptional activator/tRNA A-37 threonylcarbamoyl transferase component Bud32/WD40 repeat protein
VEFAILGPLEVQTAEGRLRLGGPRQRAVLAHLILRANLVVPAEQLIDELWGEEPPETARNTLQTYVYRLRRVLGEDRLESRSGGYVLLADAEEIDASRFESLVREARGLLQSDPGAAVLRLDEALALWRGPAFADFPDEPSLRGEIARLEDLHLVATEHRISAQLALGRHTTVIGALETLTDRHPLRERLWAGLMLALYRSGRQAEALDAYRRAREVLSDELGIDPSPELQQLHERILRQDPELLVQPTVPSPRPPARPGPGELAPGSEFAGYRIESVLGRGGMSVVYLAQHLGLERRVALKVLAPQLAEDERFRERFVRESRIAAGMEHSNIVPIYEAGEEDGLLFIAMRYVPGTDLGKLLERERTLEPERALRIVREVASALDAAHARGLVHRDVKPGNILVVEGAGSDGGDLVYLSDFGLTKRLESGTVGLTQTGQFVGTVDYVAPEQIEGKRVDSRADVYSLACVLFECLTGGVPYERDTHVAALYAHLREKPPRLTASRPDLPASVDGVLAKALSKPPAQRYASCGAFVTAARDGLGPLAGEGQGLPVSGRSSWTRWQVATAALAAALVAGVIVFSMSRGETPAAERTSRSPTPAASPSPSLEPNFRTVERALSGDEELRLLSYIPHDVAADCLPLDRDEPVQGELAALVCRHEGVEVLYELFPRPDLMNEALQSGLSINQAPEGQCARTVVAVSPYTIGGQPAGLVLCYAGGESFTPFPVQGPRTEARTTSHIEWTDERILVYAHAIRNDSSDLTLYDWWLSSAGPVISVGDGPPVLAKDRPKQATRPLRDGSYLLQVADTPDELGPHTFLFHIDGGTYEFAVNASVVESGKISFQKPGTIVFDPETGDCNFGSSSSRPAAFGWSVSGDSVTWEKQGGGPCAGPQSVDGLTFTRAPEGLFAFEVDDEIALMDPGAFRVQPLSDEIATHPNFSPEWSPDGTKIVFAGAAEDYDLYLMNADGTGVTRLTDMAGDESQPAWAPDGSRIALAYDDLGETEFRSGVGVVNPDGTGWTELVMLENLSVYGPAWSPDGSRIAFTAFNRDGHRLYVMNADGSGLMNVHEEPRAVLRAPMSWTPDGQRIVFWGEGPGKEMLLSMRPDGTDVQEFVELPDDDTAPVLEWSPDGRWIVMGGLRETRLQTGSEPAVYLMRSDGDEVFMIFGTGTEPTWRPDGD